MLDDVVGAWPEPGVSASPSRSKSAPKHGARAPANHRPAWEALGYRITSESSARYSFSRRSRVKSTRRTSGWLLSDSKYGTTGSDDRRSRPAAKASAREPEEGGDAWSKCPRELTSGAGTAVHQYNAEIQITGSPRRLRILELDRNEDKRLRQWCNEAIAL